MNASDTSGGPPSPTALTLLDELLGAGGAWSLDPYFLCRTTTLHGRMAVRAYAYSIAAEDPRAARLLLDAVEREG